MSTPGYVGCSWCSKNGGGGGGKLVEGAVELGSMKDGWYGV